MCPSSLLQGFRGPLGHCTYRRGMSERVGRGKLPSCLPLTLSLAWFAPQSSRARPSVRWLSTYTVYCLVLVVCPQRPRSHLTLLCFPTDFPRQSKWPPNCIHNRRYVCPLGKCRFIIISLSYWSTHSRGFLARSGATARQFLRRETGSAILPSVPETSRLLRNRQPSNFFISVSHKEPRARLIVFGLK